MLEDVTFGRFIAIKRKQAGFTIRELAEVVSLTPSYLCNIEMGKRPAPSGETQIMIACALNLNTADRRTLFDLAAKTKKEGTLPIDIAEYVAKDEFTCLFLRQAMQRSLSGLDLLKILNK